MWKVKKIERLIHVWPEDEEHLHNLHSRFCFCNPKIEDDLVILHASQDGREFLEEAEVIKNNPDRFL